MNIAAVRPLCNHNVNFSGLPRIDYPVKDISKPSTFIGDKYIDAQKHHYHYDSDFAYFPMPGIIDSLGYIKLDIIHNYLNVKNDGDGYSAEYELVYSPHCLA